MSEPIDRAIEIVRQKIRAAPSAAVRMHLLWAGAKAARRLASTDVMSEKFLRLADEAGLTRSRGRGDVIHVLQWASLQMNPFDRGPLHDRD